MLAPYMVGLAAGLPVGLALGVGEAPPEAGATLSAQLVVALGRQVISPRSSVAIIGPAVPPHGMPSAPLEVVAV